MKTASSLLAVGLLASASAFAPGLTAHSGVATGARVTLPIVMAEQTGIWKPKETKYKETEYEEGKITTKNFWRKHFEGHMAGKLSALDPTTSG